MKNLKNNLLLAVLIIALIMAGYFLYSYFKTGQTTSSVVKVSGESGASGDLLNMLATLQSLRIDTSFFDDPLYKSLIDFSPEITIPAQVGRVNPFFPVK